MAKAKYCNPSNRMGDKNLDINMQTNVDITESVDELIDPDLFLRSFGISDDYIEHKDLHMANVAMKDIYDPDRENKQHSQMSQGVIIKNSFSGGQATSQSRHETIVPIQNIIYASPQDNIQLHSSQQNPFAISRDSSLHSSPITLQQRGIFSSSDGDVKTLTQPSPTSDCQVTIPLQMFQSILSNTNMSKEKTLEAIGHYKGPDRLGSIVRKRNHIFNSEEASLPLLSQGSTAGIFTNTKIVDSNNFVHSPEFSMPSPVALSPIFVEQKHIPMNGSDGLISPGGSGLSPRIMSRPSPQSTPPPVQMETFRETSSWKMNGKSGRITPNGKRSRPQTPTSDCDSDCGFREREPLDWNTGRITPTESKPIRLEDMVDEDKYTKRKRSTSGAEKEGRKKDPMKDMLEQLQKYIPHIGNPDEEKVSHAGLLVEGSDYIRSLKRENNATKENVEALKVKIEQLNAEIEAFQEKLPEHGSSSIHRIVSTQGKSIPDMYADHVRQRTQTDWRYWVFTSIMGHFVHSFAQEVSNISPPDMEKTSVEWLQQRMSLSQLRKDAFRKLAKLCSKTSIMEDPSKLPEEARGFVALPDPEAEEREKAEAACQQYGNKF